MPTKSNPRTDMIRFLVHAPGCPAERTEITGEIDPGRPVSKCNDCGVTFPPADGVQRGPEYAGDVVVDYDRAAVAARARLGEV